MVATNKAKDDFSWDNTGLDEGTFRAISALVSIRNGGQVNLSTADTAGAEVQFPRGTSSAERMSEEMKRKFLDAISELIAMHGAAAQVSSAALVEDSGEITVVVARNDGFDGVDKAAIIDLFAQLEKLSRVGESYEPDDEKALKLTTTILGFHNNRLGNDYLPTLEKLVKA